MRPAATFAPRREGRETLTFPVELGVRLGLRWTNVDGSAIRRDERTMNEQLARRIGLEGAVNFRDIGGYPAARGRRVRWRHVFRSDSLSKLTDDDHAQLADLGVRTLVDFRLASERHELPNRLAASSDITSVEIGFMAEGILELLRGVSRGTVSRADIEQAFIEQYRRFVTDHSSEFARALALALDERNLPLLLHCTSGKDRTGFAICALLLALGTPQENILEDYALTNSYMRDISNFFSASTPPELLQFVMTAQPTYLQAAFDQMVRSFGSVDGYLSCALDLDDAKRSQLVALLTEER
jgi:protein-tyrosine phosphatase